MTARNQIDVRCAVCDAAFTRTPAEIRASATLYCSRTCYWSAMRAKTDADRFWSKVDKSGDCWLWNGAKTVAGYGYIHSRGGGKEYAHRLSWAIHNTGDSAGLVICHRCDNPPCVNPAHLFLGTHLDNIRDKVEKGRGAFKLDESVVREIRRAYAAGGTTQRGLAAKHGVTQRTVAGIVHRKLWKHVA